MLRLALCPVLLLLAAGCGGFNATKSISPATFLLPGLLEADPPPADPNRVLPIDEPAQQLARNP